MGIQALRCGGARVLHLLAAADELARLPHPGGERFALCELRFVSTVDIPELEDSAVEAAGIVVDPRRRRNFLDVAKQFSGWSARPDHHLLGHPQQIQGDMRCECQLVAHGIDAGHPDAFKTDRARELMRTAAADWQLLLQLDSDEKGPGWQWSDDGRIYYWIRRADLAAGAFDRAWVILQCG